MVQLSYYHFLLTITLAQSGIAMEVVSDDLRRLNSFLWGVLCAQLTTVEPLYNGYLWGPTFCPL